MAQQLIYYPYYYIIPTEAPIFSPGTKINIAIPITSKCTAQVDTYVKVIIYEGSVLATHGTKLAEYNSPTHIIAPGETHNYSVQHTTVKGTIDRRDVGAVVYYYDNGWKQGPSHEWDDVYYVQERFEFTIGTPIVTMA